MSIRGSYHNGFAPRDAEPRYPQLWQGCVGAWAPCLGPSGLTLRDWSGLANHGTLTSMDPATDWVVSGGKNALDFDGSNDYVPVVLPIGGLFQVTVSVWFYWYAYATNDDFLMEYTTNMNSPGNRGFTIDPNGSGGTFDIIVSSGGGPYNGGTIARPSAATWHHLCVLFDRTLGTANNVSAWVDGQQVTVTQTQTGNISTSFSSSSLYIASRGGSTLFGNCMMDDLMVFNGLSSQRQIKLLSSSRGIAYGMRSRRRHSNQDGGAAAIRRHLMLLGVGR